MKKIRLKSVKHKFDLIIGSMILIFAVFFYLYFPYKLKTEQVNSLTKNALSISQISAIIAGPGLFFDDYEAIAEGVEPILHDKNISYIIIEDKYDSVYYVHNHDYALSAAYRSLTQSQVEVTEHDIKLKVDIFLQDNYLGKLYLGYSLQNLYLELENAQQTITIISIFVLVLGLLFASLLGNIVTNPLTKIVETVNEITAGNLSVRTAVTSEDEIGYLGNSINNMLDIMQISQKELENKNEELSEEIAIRKITEQNLKISENRFRLIFHKSNDFIFLSEILKDNTDRLIEVNDVICNTLHYTSQELYGKSYKVLLSPSAQQENNLMNKILADGSIIYESAYKSRDGNEIIVEVNANLFDLHGRKVILSIARNITDRKYAEAALRESEERFRSIYNNATIGIYRTTPNGDILMVNPALIEMLGFTSFEEMQNSGILKNGYAKTESRAKFKELVEDKGVISGFEAIWNRVDNSKIYVRESARAVRNSEGKTEYYEGVVEDISNWKETELALIKAKEKAEESDRLKSEFLAQMSHEIRTPINTILNFTSLLKMETEDKISDELAGGFDSIENAANRLLRTINLVLNMSDIESGTYEAKPSYSNIIDEVLRPVQLEFANIATKKNLSLLLTNNCTDDKVFIDNYTLTQVIANLVDNAIKYTDKGKVAIIIGDVENGLLVSVQDTGIGIGKEYIPKLFNKFSQEEQGYTRRYEGNGLGLALVKKYCEINKAEITVRSEKGKGTSFDLLLPRNKNN